MQILLGVKNDSLIFLFPVVCVISFLKSLLNEVIRFIEDHKLLKIMKEKSAISFDGLGAQRIIKQIEKNINV